MRLLVIVLLTLGSFFAAAQCLTDFVKHVPEPALDFSEGFAAVSISDDYLAIGVPQSDSLGHASGLVYLYWKSNGNWQKVATITPSQPLEGLQFGLSVKLTRDYLLVGCAADPGKVYLFEKPPAGWTAQTEKTVFSIPGSRSPGVHYSGNTLMAVSEDQQTIAIADAFYDDPASNRSGAVFVFHKNAVDEWNGVAPVRIVAPDEDAGDFGKPGVAILGDRIITGSPFAGNGNGRLYVYRDASGTFQNLQLEAQLETDPFPGSGWLASNTITCTSDGIFASVVLDVGSPQQRNVIAFFEKPPADWVNSSFTCILEHPEAFGTVNPFPTISANGNEIIASSRSNNGKGYTTSISKGAAGWCSPIYEIIDTNEMLGNQIQSRYGIMNGISQTGGFVVGNVSHPLYTQHQTAIEVFSPGSTPGLWDGQVLAGEKMSTASHAYGVAVATVNDMLFVGAPYDGTLKPNGGVVYAYKKNGEEWLKAGKLTGPAARPNDMGFGLSIAANSTQIALGSRFGEHGRVFIYGPSDEDWSQAELFQEIELPEDILTVFAYGDHLAMNDEWLVIPYVQNAPARLMIAIYRFDGDQWVYHQAIDLGMGGFFSRYTTVPVDIEGETIIAAGYIVEYNRSQAEWLLMYELTPSDPEYIELSPDFTLISNGSGFGYDVDISGNSIFISAPGKDDGSTWDVGAIYVFTKHPWESWSSRTESLKILPRVRTEGEYFGYSMEVLGNTLIAGAPGADLLKDGSARNEPGRAYIFQTTDFFWADVTRLVDFTGDSFEKDYFGLTVALHPSGLIVGAPAENIPTGKRSGAIYVADPPPIVKLIPPVCSGVEIIELFGYPFGGTWEGPGVIDAAKGLVDAKAIGVGVHEFIYTTESCTHKGRLRVSIEEPLVATITGDPERLVCPFVSVQVPLSLDQQDENYLYTWYYRASETDVFFPLNSHESSIVAVERGEYHASVQRGQCVSTTQTVKIKNENVELELTQISRLCEDKTPITLQATPAGGEWTGPGVVGNTLVTTGLPNGTHTLRYRYVSPLQCPYEHSIPVTLERLPIPQITHASGSLCRTGSVLIDAKMIKNGVEYQWILQKAGEGATTVVGTNPARFTADERGTYWLTANDGECRTESNKVTIAEDPLSIKIQPDETDITRCHDSSAQIWVMGAEGDPQYEWFVRKTPQGPALPLNDASGPSIDVSESGYYFARVISYSCETQTEPRRVIISPREQLLVPNVFTPNGDGINDEFTLDTDFEVQDVRIYNRYGDLLHASPSSNWTGTDAPMGVYFYFVKVMGCADDVETRKGTVHLVR